MISKSVFVILVLGLLVVEFKYTMLDDNNTQDDKLPVKVLSFHTSAGWGYEIMVDGKTFIHQDYIPAVQGNKSFQSPEDALKVGNYLLEKMKKKERPFITVDELKGMKIKQI